MTVALAAAVAQVSEVGDNQLIMRMRFFALLALISIAGGAAACGSSTSTPPPPPAGTKTVDPATAGSIKGRVLLEGAAPAAEHIRMNTDAACVQNAGPNPQSDAVLVGADGALQNAFVYLKTGVDPDYAFPVPTNNVELDQKGCTYSPRVVGLRAGQALEVVNSDDTLHNVHALPKVNQEFNQSTPIKGFRMSHTFTTPEVMVRFMCNVHQWMTAYVGVVAHPFFQVTRADGSFDLTGVPPGTYTVQAWHEKFGTSEQSVTIGNSQTQTITFKLAAKGDK